MKKVFTNTLLVAAISLAGASVAQANYYGSPQKIDGQYFSIGVDYLDMKVDRFEISGGSPAVELGYGYRFNRYFEVGATVHIRTSDAITSEHVDTYAEPNHDDIDNVFLAEPTSKTYENSLKNSAFIGLHAKASYPISNNIDAYVTVGVSQGKIEHSGYYNAGNYQWLDHKNQATTTDEYNAGIKSGKSPCQLTGVESEAYCGNPIQSYSEDFSSVSPSYGVGLRWSWYDSGSFNIINVGAKSLFNKDDFQVFSYGINYEFQF